MKENNRSQLSALVDDELSVHELASVLNVASRDAEYRRVWERYNMIGDYIRGETGCTGLCDIADGVRTRLEQEPTLIAPAALRQQRVHQWVRPVTGVAIAASVAVVAILAAPTLINIASDSPPPLAATADRQPAQLYAERAGTRWNLNQPEVESKLNGYLVNHQEYVPAGGMKGMLPYATIVSYDSGR